MGRAQPKKCCLATNTCSQQNQHESTIACPDSEYTVIFERNKQSQYTIPLRHFYDSQHKFEECANIANNQNTHLTSYWALLHHIFPCEAHKHPQSPNLYNFPFHCFLNYSFLQTPSSIKTTCRARLHAIAPIQFISGSLKLFSLLQTFNKE
jgi:hypothetical protein